MQTPSELSAVLEKLTEDDFRERLLGDPVGALRDMGITLRQDQVPAVRSLPSKASIAAERQSLHSKLVANERMVPFLLSGSI